MGLHSEDVLPKAFLSRVSEARAGEVSLVKVGQVSALASMSLDSCLGVATVLMEKGYKGSSILGRW